MAQSATAAVAVEPFDVPDYDYEKAPEKREPVSARVPISLVKRLAEIVELWKLEAKIKGDDPDTVDRTHVIEVLLRTGIDGVWARRKELTGMDPPQTDADWAVLEKALRKARDSKK